MAMTPPALRFGGIQIRLQNAQLREDLLLDEVDLDGGNLSVEPMEDGQARITSDETRFRAMMSEPNLNRVLAANLPPDVPVRNLKLAVLSGKVRFSMHTTGFISLPITLEAIPRVDNGVRISLDWQGLNAIGIPLPAQLVEVLEQKLNKTLDLTKSPVPVWLDEIRCEPGRLSIFGKARIAWPPPVTAPTAPPFSVRAATPSVEASPPVEILPPAEDPTLIAQS